MSDLIKREDAIKAIEELPNAYNGWSDAYDKAYIIGTLEEVPSADRPQGEWVRTGRTNVYGGIEVQCSNCGDRVMVQHLEDEWYCRHCGADMGMKGADDE